MAAALIVSAQYGHSFSAEAALVWTASPGSSPEPVAARFSTPAPAATRPCAALILNRWRRCTEGIYVPFGDDGEVDVPALVRSKHEVCAEGHACSDDSAWASLLL